MTIYEIIRKQLYALHEELCKESGSILEFGVSIELPPPIFRALISSLPDSRAEAEYDPLKRVVKFDGFAIIQRTEQGMTFRNAMDRLENLENTLRSIQYAAKEAAER